MNMQKIRYGGRDIPFSLERSDRKRLRIEVFPDSRVRVLAPADAPHEVVLKSVRAKAKWVVRQQRYFKQFEPRTTQREYVSGETHLYLGRRYRLLVRAVDGADEESVKLVGRFINLYCKDASDFDHKRLLLDAWYRGHAERVFSDVLADLLEKRALRELDTPELKIRKMKKRWGSCTPNGTVLLNPLLIKAPRRCIEYVVAHELCHLVVPDHSQSFERLLTRVVPDWRERKALLERATA